jgi:hypothetical protein
MSPRDLASGTRTGESMYPVVVELTEALRLSERPDGRPASRRASRRHY